MPELQVSAPDGTERRFPLEGRPISVGRSDECDVVIAEPRASRRHCTFKPLGGGWRVVDDQSSNGTWLGGKPILAARLQAGDEVEIGETVLTFDDAAGAGATAPTVQRVRRPRPASAPWGLLAIPVVAIALAALAASWAGREEDRISGDAWRRYAVAEVARADRAATPNERTRALEKLRTDLAAERGAGSALRVVDVALATERKPPVAETRGDASGALAGYEAKAGELTSPQRRARLRELLGRHADDGAALARIRALLAAEESGSGERLRQDRERTLAEADRAVADGRLGVALDLWDRWVLRAPSLDRDEERELAQRMAALRERAREEAATAAGEIRKLAAEGRDDAARSRLEATLERLRGTGWGGGRAARAGARPAPAAAGGPTAAEGRDAASTKERTRVLHAIGAAEDLARVRRFADAAAALGELAATVGDAPLRREIDLRATDLRAEAALLSKVLLQAKEEPKRFSPVTLDGRQRRLVSAGPEGLTLLAQGDTSELVAVEALPAAAVVQLVDHAQLEPSDWVPAALTLHDLGDSDGYTRYMRQAVATAELQETASQVHARILGRADVPTGGYVPHPDDPSAIVTQEEWKAIKNRARIAVLTADLDRLVERVEKSTQAKAVEKVREAYAALEQTREQALALIFDEQKYFYPYRDRMREYAPVQQQVDKLVAAVRDAWASKASAKPRADSSMEKLLAEVDDLRTEIEFLGGSAISLVERADKVRRYLGRDLTVHNFFETPADLELHEYNARVMKENDGVKGPTDPEREQVRITNEYRMLFGHRRALRIDARLVESARGHSDDMARLGFFDHFSPVPGKRGPDDRVRLAGYPAAGCSENIAMAGGSPESAHTGWIHSSGHHRNLLSPAWVEMGSGLSGRLWTQNFGFRVDDEPAGETPR